MPRTGRRMCDAGALTMWKAAPAIVLLVSAPALAQERSAAPSNSPADDADERDSARAAHVGGKRHRGLSEPLRDALIVPLDPHSGTDSAFMRQLLLSHGIALDLGEDGTLDADALATLLDGRATAAGIGVQRLDGDALDMTVVLDMRNVLEAQPAEAPIEGADDPTAFRTRYYTLPDPVPGVQRAVEPPPNILRADATDGGAPAFLQDSAPDIGAEQACELDAALVARLRAGLAISDDRANVALWTGIDRNFVSVPGAARLPDGVSTDWRRTWFACEHVDAFEALIGPGVTTDGSDAVTAGVDRRSAPPVDADDVRGTNADGFLISEDAPPGFEGLLGPRTQSVDVYFNDRPRGSLFITVTVDSFTFDDPDAVLAMLPEVLDPPALLPALATSLPTNAASRCYAQNDPPGCGVVEADPLAAIYDEDQLRLDLFVDPSLQAVASLDTATYLDSPDTRGTSILSLGAVASALPGGDDGVDLYARGVIGLGAGSLIAGIDHETRQGSTRLRELRYTRYDGGVQTRIGGFGFSPGGALGDADLLGIGVQTSYRTRLDLDAAFSSELVLFLARRSVVQIVVDDRVLSGDSYAPGNQVIDTSALPEGTYEIEIRITDAAGTTRVERRVFSKSTDIPPRGETVFALTAGQPLLFGGTDIDGEAADAQEPFVPERGSEVALAASLSRRFNERSAWRLGALQLADASHLQGGIIYLGPTLSAQFEGTVGEHAVRAGSARLGFSAGPFTTGLSLLSVRSDAAARDGELGQRIIFDDVDQVGATLATSLGRTQLGVRAIRRREPEPDVADGRLVESTTLGAFARRPLFNRRNLRGALSADVERDEQRTRVGLDVTFSWSRGRSSSSLSGGLERIDEGDVQASAGVRTRYRSAAAATVDWEVGARADRRDARESAGVRASVEHPWFGARASTDWTRFDDDTTGRSSVASINAQVGIDRRGAAVGGQSAAESGVIVDISGEPAGEPFDIVVNGMAVATGRIGQRQFVALQPFQSYSVALRAQGVLDNGLGNGVENFTLFPGSVARIDRITERRVLLIASLIDEAGELIVDALIETADNPALVDTSGVFQAEVAPGSELSVRLIDDRRCTFTVPDTTEEVLIADAPLACRAQ